MNDPRGWITIDEVTGSILTSKILDRETLSPRSEVYNITVLVTDQGNILGEDFYEGIGDYNKVYVELFLC